MVLGADREALVVGIEARPARSPPSSSARRRARAGNPNGAGVASCFWTMKRLPLPLARACRPAPPSSRNRACGCRWRGRADRAWPWLGRSSVAGGLRAAPSWPRPSSRGRFLRRRLRLALLPRSTFFSAAIRSTTLQPARGRGSSSSPRSSRPWPCASSRSAPCSAST